MTDQRSSARRIMAASSVVVAVCAVIVTIKVMNTDLTDVPPDPVVLDPVAVEQAVKAHIGQQTDRVSCPVYLVAEADNTFSCTYWVEDIPKTVEVKMSGGQGEISLVT
ncbi:DUF4333 domain-containing protein [Streptomyces sp. NPDC060275]|uniref:DUF4333 domain-containing protein n=1 Tax=Streptomyces sp. NPDC060275 TaxID=3347090 RepID=UPI003668DB24